MATPILWLVAASSILLALSLFSAVGSLWELAAACRRRTTGHGVETRKRQARLAAVLLTAYASAAVQSSFLDTGLWRQIGLPDAPRYSPWVAMVALVTASAFALRAEKHFETPQNVLDLLEDLKLHWAGFEVLTKPRLWTVRRQLEAFRKSDGGRAISDSARPLNRRLESEIEERLQGDYRDVRIPHLFHRISLRMVLGFLQALRARAIWLLLPALSATLLAGLLLCQATVTGFRAGLLPMAIAFLVLLIGLGLGLMNVWIRLAIRLREYCRLKRQEQLCGVYIEKLHTLATPVEHSVGRQVCTLVRQAMATLFVRS